MTAEEVASYVSELVKVLDPLVNVDESTQTPPVDPKHSIGENYVTCLECGKKFKVMTIRHLKLHGLTAKEYKAKWGLKKSVSLSARVLGRMRRKKMQDMRLWERRGKNKAEVEE